MASHPYNSEDLVLGCMLKGKTAIKLGEIWLTKIESAYVTALKKCVQVLEVRKQGEETIQHYLLTSREMPAAEQSAAIAHAAAGSGLQ